ncbi:LacI family DNA-binding transcriptional regulator [Maribacter confluentis]|uniref:Transcriptional regulator, LacI family n=2 Tax=Maribacter TaxID=252356 RepID=A0ABY1SF99_9FLAO|nr:MULTISPECIES: LacI family DNA-binding transcriptional regulator [Maribacter]MDO1511590.1 LacI family DNA-binding transcriptional regulator [Maribacter confluentis]TVZ14811.1 LacI family transcriptional regulator [Maribacter sp. MAR_2009_72]SNR40049.1 transcriptional regulator, LacI family [Maribacter sedimenticola]
MKKVTLKDIAGHFKVSISTVSKAVNDSHEISADLKAKIQEYAKAKHYKPNRLALNLLNRSTKTIGVVVPNILNYFFVQVLYGIEKVANENGYNIISCISDESSEKESKTLEFFDSGTVDGLIISLAEETQNENKHDALIDIINNDIPVVLFDRVADALECDKVVVDDFEAGYKTTKHLINVGCTNIAVVNPTGSSSVGKLRLLGYKKALEEFKIPFDAKLVMNLTPKDDLDLLMSFLLNYKTIEGIIGFDEITAVKVLEIVKARGYNVPNDISIIGFTNGQLSKYVTPSLTMVSQHGKYIGELTAKLLINRIQNPGLPYETKTVKTSLLVRGSTKKMQ